MRGGGGALRTVALLCACVAIAACGTDEPAESESAPADTQAESASSPTDLDAMTIATKRFLSGVAQGDLSAVCSVAGEELISIVTDSGEAACETAPISPVPDWAALDVAAPVVLGDPIVVTVATRADGVGTLVFLADGDEVEGVISQELPDTATDAASRSPEQALTALLSDTRPAVNAVGRILSGLPRVEAEEICSAISDSGIVSLIDAVYDNDNLDDNEAPSQKPTCQDLVDTVINSLQDDGASAILETGAGLRGFVDTDELGYVEIVRTVPSPGSDDSPPWVGTRAWLAKRRGEWLVIGIARATSDSDALFNSFE